MPDVEGTVLTKTLEELLSGRYHYNMKNNMRNYCWEINEVSQFYDKILKHDTKDKFLCGFIVVSEMGKEDMTDLERQACKDSESSVTILEVKEGRQRMTTTVAFLAGMRDTILECPVQLDEYTKEKAYQIQKILAPTRCRKMDPLPRILGQESSYLEELLLPKKKTNNKAREDRLAQAYTEEDKCVRNAYMFFKERVSLAGMKAGKSDENEDLLNRLHNTYSKLMGGTAVMELTFTSAVKATRFVENQEYGKPQELVDWCRHHLCHHKLDKDRKEVQNATKAAWDDLTKEVGRKTVSAACTIVAQFVVQEWMTHESEGSQLFQRFIDQSMPIASSCLFKEFIYPAAKALRWLRNPYKNHEQLRPGE